MKKIILSTLVLFVLSACKKEVPKTEDEVTTIDSVSVSAPEPEINTASLNIFTPQQASDFLGKKNDTLYVTNFFATWCGPCVREIPFFKNKIDELKGKPVKFTFISVDSRDDWNTKVPQFTNEFGISEHTVLLDGSQLDGNFFTNNFEKWNGGAIPFTFMRKGEKTDEHLGLMTQEILDSKISSFIK